ncbi:hypothetical protein [Bradyrhizobium sp. SZCCHNR1093]|uniref:hypothetical protein n=1 Tax=Bradyrhizobium sp. SZCCHNR1093 TaxID=3057368 RepID=UPI0028ED5384|nr:hypothetical protein [Bradyrhizobium sp. SZCCHNR1093]
MPINTKGSPAVPVPNGRNFIMPPEPNLELFTIVGDDGEIAQSLSTFQTTTRRFALSRLITPESRDRRPFDESRGRRECRVKASPMARLLKKMQAAGTTGSADQPAFPARQS